MEQGDVAGGKAHLRVGLAVYDAGGGGGVYSGRNLQELVLVFVVWCGGHGCEEMRKSTRDEVTVARFGIRKRQMMIIENIRRNQGQMDDKKGSEVDGKHLMLKLIMRIR